MSETINHIGMLGHKATDKVTGLQGVITSMAFDLYGCIQAVLTPEATDGGKVPDGLWMDVARLEITSKKPVMELPNYNKGYVAQGRKGAAEKPMM